MPKNPPTSHTEAPLCRHPYQSALLSSKIHEQHPPRLNSGDAGDLCDSGDSGDFRDYRGAGEGLIRHLCPSVKNPFDENLPAGRLGAELIFSQ